MEAVLATRAEEYARRDRQRPAADPIGLRGLPEDREGLDRMLTELCARLKSAGKHGLKGLQLAFELGLGRDTRAVRELIAYARVHKRIHQIVGVPGSRYFWGDAAPDLYVRMIRHAERCGRDWFYLAALFRRQGLGDALAQQVFDFLRPDAGDELAALVARDGADAGDVLEALLDRLAESPAGQARLERLRHRFVRGARSRPRCEISPRADHGRTGTPCPPRPARIG